MREADAALDPWQGSRAQSVEFALNPDDQALLAVLANASARQTDAIE